MRPEHPDGNHGCFVGSVHPSIFPAAVVVLDGDGAVGVVVGRGLPSDLDRGGHVFGRVPRGSGFRYALSRNHKPGVGSEPVDRNHRLATGLSREDAMALLRELQDAERRLRVLRDGLRALLAEEVTSEP